MLQKYHLELDGMLDRVAVVFHPGGLARLCRELLHQCGVRDRVAKRSLERLPRQPDTIRMPVMRRSQDDERTPGVLRRERRVGGPIGLDAAEGTYVRRGDS